MGAVVKTLPEGAEEVEVNGAKLLKYNGTLYQPVVVSGEDSYEVVEGKK
jgi:hypothetical protein